MEFSHEQLIRIKYWIDFKNWFVCVSDWYAVLDQHQVRAGCSDSNYRVLNVYWISIKSLTVNNWIISGVSNVKMVQYQTSTDNWTGKEHRTSFMYQTIRYEQSTEYGTGIRTKTGTGPLTGASLLIHSLCWRPEGLQLVLVKLLLWFSQSSGLQLWSSGTLSCRS